MFRPFIMPSMPRIIRCIPSPFIFFIIFCMCLCCFKRRFSSGMPVPDPVVIRRFREPKIKSGFRRSLGVMEFIIASILANWLLST